MQCSSGRGTPSIASTRSTCGRPCAGSCRRSSRPASTRAISTSARSRRTFSRRVWWPRRCRRRGVRRRASRARSASRAAPSPPCSCGGAPCKVVGKVASHRRKPGGLVVVVPGQEAGFLAPLDVRKLPGVGPKAEERLRAAGVTTVGELAALSDELLRRVLPGSVGKELRDRANGIDPRGLELNSERISISVENTFERDVVDRERLHDELRGMAAEGAARLQKKGQVGRTGPTKLRYADCAIPSRSSSLDVGIDDPATIAELACRLLDRVLEDRPGALRLVGVGVSGLAAYRQLALDDLRDAQV